MGFDASRRATEPELMDIEACTYDELRCCLRDLAAVNRLTLGYRPTLAFLNGVVRNRSIPSTRTIEIWDVGSGYGDTLRAISRWADHYGIAVSLTGIDVNPLAIEAARGASAEYPNISWVQCRALEAKERIGRHPDIILSALFAHHLDDDGQARFLNWMNHTARCGWFVNDLLRHPISYWGFKLLSQAARWHRFVQHDGPLSIARSFRREDWHRAFNRAGIQLSSVDLESWAPFRLCISCIK